MLWVIHEPVSVVQDSGLVIDVLARLHAPSKYIFRNCDNQVKVLSFLVIAVDKWESGSGLPVTLRRKVQLKRNEKFSYADTELTEADFNRCFKGTSAHEIMLSWNQSPTL